MEFTGTEYIKIDVANQFGLDRLSWKDRLHWVEDNRGSLLSLKATAENETGFEKAYRALECAEQGVTTNHIMGLDATASGIQIMAAMSGCFDSAKTVNLINTGNREDLYSSVANHMSESVPVSRKQIKHPVMTFFYGSEAVPKQVFGEDEALKVFYATLVETLPGCYELMQLMQSCWNPNATSYEWAMPDGHVVHVPVSMKQDMALEIDETTPHTRYSYRAEVITPKLKGRALAANIVHSVDGWVCRQMVKKAKAQDFYMAPIHDCFFAHPNHMNKVRQMYRECLNDVCQMNLVSIILSQITERTVSYSKISSGLGIEIMQSEYALS